MYIYIQSCHEPYFTVETNNITIFGQNLAKTPFNASSISAAKKYETKKEETKKLNIKVRMHLDDLKIPSQLNCILCHKKKFETLKNLKNLFFILFLKSICSNTWQTFQLPFQMAPSHFFLSFRHQNIYLKIRRKKKEINRKGNKILNYILWLFRLTETSDYWMEAIRIFLFYVSIFSKKNKNEMKM